MARRPLLARRLTKREQRKLDELFRHPPSPGVHERALAIRLSVQGQSAPQIARALKRDASTVFRWVRSFNSAGLEALEPGKSPGAPRKADEDVCSALDAAVRSNPRDLGYSFTRWTGELLAQHIYRKLHVKLSIHTVYRALHRMGHGYLRPKLGLKHKQNAWEVARAKRQKRAAQKKSQPAPVVVLSRFSTRLSSTSTHS
jgi:transposase